MPSVLRLFVRSPPSVHTSGPAPSVAELDCGRGTRDSANHIQGRLGVSNLWLVKRCSEHPWPFHTHVSLNSQAELLSQNARFSL